MGTQGVLFHSWVTYLNWKFVEDRPPRNLKFSPHMLQGEHPWCCQGMSLH